VREDAVIKLKQIFVINKTLTYKKEINLSIKIKEKNM